MANTYTLISSNVLSSSAASVTFSAIPSTYTDLVLRVSARSDRASTTDTFKITLNGNTSAIYSNTRLWGTGSSALTNNASGQTTGVGGTFDGSTATASTFGSDEIYIPSYTVAQNKPFSVFSADETNATAANISVYAGLFSSTAAVSSILFESVFGTNIVSGSSFYLYGIKNS